MWDQKICGAAGRTKYGGHPLECEGKPGHAGNHGVWLHVIGPLWEVYRWSDGLPAYMHERQLSENTYCQARCPLFPISCRLNSEHEGPHRAAPVGGAQIKWNTMEPQAGCAAPEPDPAEVRFVEPDHYHFGGQNFARLAVGPREARETRLEREEVIPAASDRLGMREPSKPAWLLGAGLDERISASKAERNVAEKKMPWDFCEWGLP